MRNSPTRTIVLATVLLASHSAPVWAQQVVHWSVNNLAVVKDPNAISCDPGSYYAISPTRPDVTAYSEAFAPAGGNTSCQLAISYTWDLIASSYASLNDALQQLPVANGEADTNVSLAHSTNYVPPGGENPPPPPSWSGSGLGGASLGASIAGYPSTSTAKNISSPNVGSDVSVAPFSGPAHGLGFTTDASKRIHASCTSFVNAQSSINVAAGDLGTAHGQGYVSVQWQ